MVDGEDGRFTVGNPGGPGRPAKSAKDKQLGDCTLRDLAEPPTGPELYLAAKMLEERDQWMEFIDSDFPKALADKVKRIVIVSEMAQTEIIRRLRRLPI